MKSILFLLSTILHAPIDLDSFVPKENLDNSTEMEEFLKAAHKDLVEFEEEDLFHPELLKNPGREIGIISTKEVVVPEEKIIAVCREGTVESREIAQKRVVNVVPAEIRRFKKCKGHRDKSHLQKDYIFWQKHIEEQEKRWKKKYGKNPNIKTFKISTKQKDLFWIGDQAYIYVDYWHHDDSGACNQPWEEIVVKPAYIDGPDRWESENPGALDTLEKNPQCTCVSEEILKGPETRTLNGLEVSRNSWAKKLIFSCKDEKGCPDCSQLRAKGALFVAKKCVEKDVTGGCAVWEKTYDLGKKGATSTNVHTFEEGKKIGGLNGEFDRSYEKDTSFLKAAAALSVLADLEKGEAVRRNSSAPDPDGLCHYVGYGADKKRVFCCFASKRARLAQEEARLKLGIGWGSVEEPDCRGLSIEELTQVDVAEMNLTELEETLGIDGDELNRKVRSFILSNLEQERGNHAS